MARKYPKHKDPTPKVPSTPRPKRRIARKEHDTPTRAWIHALRFRNTNPMTPAQIARATGVPDPSVRRILQFDDTQIRTVQPQR
ncbi:hypothetical protein BP5796_09285 [Coleophoma crateriformis]|uniref:HTH iclR-type domain-containing protein n=1 Tax=Coleophoma crateriformis TaxID=565419 RepID=A0A3D8R3U9_9HELO|nr:hypothetical protein BP5796_09285 [Coleophoma crateriformis]